MIALGWNSWTPLWALLALPIVFVLLCHIICILTLLFCFIKLSDGIDLRTFPFSRRHILELPWCRRNCPCLSVTPDPKDLGSWNLNSSLEVIGQSESSLFLPAAQHHLSCFLQHRCLPQLCLTRGNLERLPSTPHNKHFLPSTRGFSRERLPAV